MAAKTLTQLVGSQHEIGDIIRSVATSLDDGRALVPCDGALITPASRPLLEAKMSTGIHMGRPSWKKDSAGLLHNRAEQIFAMSQTNGIIVGGSTETQSQIQWTKEGSAQVENTWISGAGYGGAAISDDGNDSMVVSTISGSGALSIKYNQAGAAPTTGKTIDSVPVYDITVNPWCSILMHADGSRALIIGNENNDNLHSWYSNVDGNFGSAWAEQSDINPSVAGSRVFGGFSRASNALETIVFTSSKGLWISRDLGVTYTQDVTPGKTTAPTSVAVTGDGALIYCVDNVTGSTLYKSTDFGVTWTSVFDLYQQIPAPPITEDHVVPNMQHVEVDSSDNIYLFSTQTTENTAPDKWNIFLSYSDDGGVSWVHSSLMYIQRDEDGGANGPILGATRDLHVAKDGSLVRWAANVGTDLDQIVEVTLTSGKFPPHLHGQDWKLVAD